MVQEKNGKSTTDQSAEPKVIKKARRGITNEVRGAARIKFSQRDANPQNGLFLTRQVNYGEEECKEAVMYALHLHPKAWGFAVLRKLFGGGRTVCSIVTISRKGVQKWQK